jgi:hypothetical protein
MIQIHLLNEKVISSFPANIVGIVLLGRIIGNKLTILGELRNRILFRRYKEHL